MGGGDKGKGEDGGDKPSPNDPGAKNNRGVREGLMQRFELEPF